MPDGGFVTIHEEVPTRVVNVGNGGVPFSRMAPNTTARYLDETIGLILTTKEPASQQYDPDLEELIVRLVAL